MFIVDIPYQHTAPAAEVRHAAPAPRLVHAITPPAGPSTLLYIKYTGPAGRFFETVCKDMGYRYIPSRHPARVQGSIVTVTGTLNALHALQQAAYQLPQKWVEKLDVAKGTLRIETDPYAHWAPPAGYKEWTK